MAVYPDDSRPVPKGAYTPSTAKALQSVTESSARNAIRSRSLVPWEEGRSNFFSNIIGGIGQALRDGIRGVASTVSSMFDPVYKAAEVTRDGQQDLNNRVDLLSPIQDYGSLFMRAGMSRSAGLVPFTEQIGPMRNCEKYMQGIRFLDKGLWDIRVQLTANATPPLVAYDMMIASVRVYSPNGSEFSRQTAYISSRNTDSLTVISSVVVPESNYYVRIYVDRIGRGRTLAGGPGLTRFTVQHITRAVVNADLGVTDEVSETAQIIEGETKEIAGGEVVETSE